MQLIINFSASFPEFSSKQGHSLRVYFWYSTSAIAYVYVLFVSGSCFHIGCYKNKSDVNCNL